MTKTKIILIIFAIMLSPIVFLLVKYSYHVWDHNNKIEQGICPSIGRKLTEEEKIDYAFYYMSTSIKIDEKYYNIIKPKPPKISKAGYSLRKYRIFDYNKNEVEQFKNKNPDCCKYQVGSWEKSKEGDYVTGYNIDSDNPGYVILRYKAHYIDDGENKSVNKVDIISTYSCGFASDAYISHAFIKEGK